MTTTRLNPCAACPWRTANHGKRHKHSFYTKRNLTRLWNQIRRGGRIQSCHPTDPGHRDHEAKPGSTPQECAGSVILVTRELRHACGLGGKQTELTVDNVEDYLRKHSRDRKGLTRSGMRYFTVVRPIPRPFGEGNPLPPVDLDLLDSPEYGRVHVERA